MSPYMAYIRILWVLLWSCAVMTCFFSVTRIIGLKWFESQAMLTGLNMVNGLGFARWFSKKATCTWLPGITTKLEQPCSLHPAGWTNPRSSTILALLWCNLGNFHRNFSTSDFQGRFLHWSSVPFSGAFRLQPGISWCSSKTRGCSFMDKPTRCSFQWCLVAH